MVRHRALGRRARDHDVRQVDRERLPRRRHDRDGRGRECVHGPLALDVRRQSDLHGRGRRHHGCHGAREHTQTVGRARQTAARCARRVQEAVRVHRRCPGHGVDAGDRVRRRSQDQGAVAEENDRLPGSGQARGIADRQGRSLRQRDPHRALYVDQQVGHRRRLHADGARARRREMTLPARTPLANEDLLPVAPDRRTWNWWHIASLWIGMAICIPTYTLASGLVDQGWTWQAAVGAVVLGNLVVLLPIALNSHAGTRYGIPFPVLARSSFGVLGANIPAILRGLVACGWFGIQTWIGGWAIYKLIEVMWPGIAHLPQLLPAFVGLNTGEFLCFMLFWAMNVWIVLRGMDSIKFLETWGSPFLLAVGVALFVWALVRAGGIGPMLQNPSGSAVGRLGGLGSVF